MGAGEPHDRILPASGGKFLAGESTGPNYRLSGVCRNEPDDEPRLLGAPWLAVLLIEASQLLMVHARALASEQGQQAAIGEPAPLSGEFSTWFVVISALTGFACIISPFVPLSAVYPRGTGIGSRAFSKTLSIGFLTLLNRVELSL